MQALEQNLKDLHALLIEEKAANVLNPVQIISDINDFLARVSSDEIGLCSSILFDDERGILTFVDASLRLQRNNKVMTNARKAAFDLLDNYIKQISSKIAEFAQQIVKFCLNIFRREQSNTVKQATFSPIIRILDNFSSTMSAESIGISEMFDIYLREYLRGKSGQTVKGSILFILGVLSEYYPGELHQSADQLINIYMDTLKTQSTKTEPDSQLIANCFKGLSHYLVQFGEGVEEGSKYVKVLYQFMCKGLELTEASRHDVPKAALGLLARHAQHFKEYLTVDAEKMFNRIEALCTHRNDKVRRAGFPALESFLSQVAYELLRGARNVESNLKTFKTLMTKFKLLLDTRGSSKYMLSIAIRAFGQFGPPMKKFMGESDTKMLLLSLFKFSDQLLTRSQEDLEESITHLPSFIAAFANIVLELDEIDEWIIDQLEKIIGVVFMVFPKQFLFPKYRYANYISLVKLFISLYMKQNSLSKLLSRVIFQGITLTISSSSVIGNNDALMRETNVDSLYVEYLELWHNLLNPSNIQLGKWNYPWSELTFGPELQDSLHELIYDKIMESIIQMINKFDLRCTITQTDNDDDEFNPSDITSHLKPQNPKDFELFLNLVDFSKKFLRRCKPKHFLRWVFVFSKLLIERANKYPYISGFYKLLTVGMKICDRFQYFENLEALPAPQTEVVKAEPIDLDESTIENKETTENSESRTSRQTCFQMMSKFSKEIMLRLHEFKGELLASCIKFVLAMPRQFITNAKQYVAALKIAFELGLSYLPLANVGLDALEYWLKVLSHEQIEPILSSIMPSLNEYLIVRSAQSEDVEGGFDLKRMKPRRSKNTVDKSSVDVDKRKKQLARKIFSDSDQSPLQATQLRIIRLLGQFGGKNRMLLQEDSETNKKYIVAWDTSQRVQFPFTFRDSKPEIYFDSVLPRVIELAEKSGDRQTKIAACEFLHSVVLFMIGRNAYSPLARQRAQQSKEGGEQGQQDSEPTPFYKIYKRIFPSLLKLAVDSEQVTKQLYEPFIYQTVHWFTQNMQFENRETMALLDAIVDGLSNPQDGALRDLCASLLDEFLKWSIKHDKSYKFINVKSLFQRLYSNLHHPNVYKRLGAFLAFNKMYRTFREVSELVDAHALDWLHNVIISLKLSVNDDESTGIQARANELVSHIEKIIVYKKSVLLQEKERGYHRSLESAVDWIFEQCGAVEPLCRQQAMKIFPSLCMCLPDFTAEDGPRRWLQSRIQSNGIQYVMRIVEHFRGSQKGASKYSILMIWLTDIESALDSAAWLFTNQLVFPHQVFTASKTKPTEESKKVQDGTQLMRHLSRFSNEFATKDISEFKFDMTVAEEQKLLEKKCSVILKVIEFSTLMAEKFTDTTVKFQEYLLSPGLLKLVGLSTLCPQRVGFNTTQEKVQTALPYLCKKFFTAVNNNATLKPLCIDSINAILKGLLQGDELLNILNFDLSNPGMNLDEATFLFRGYRLLDAFSLLEQNLAQSKQIVCTRVGTKIFEHEKQLSPVQRLIARELWELCFEFGFRGQILMKFLLDDKPWGKEDLISQKLTHIEGDDDMETESSAKISRAKLATKGEVFYKNFSPEIDKFVALNFPVFSKDLITAAASNPAMFVMLLNIGDYIIRHKPNEGSRYVTEICKHMQALYQKYAQEDNSDNSSAFEYKLNIMKLFEKCNKIDSSAFINPASPAFKLIVQIYVDGLKSKKDIANLSLDLKMQAIRALPAILQLDQKESSSIMLQEIKSIVINEFPLSFKELEQNTSDFDDHILLLEELMNGMQKSISVKYLEQVLPLFRWRDHPIKEKMTRALKNLFSKLGNEQLIQASNVCLDTFFNETLPIDIRQAVIQWVLMVCLQQMQEKVLINFYEDNIKRLIGAINNVTKFDGNEEEVKALYVTRTCTFNLFEAMYRLLPAAAVKDAINKKYCGNKSGLSGKELTEKIIRAAHMARAYEPPEKELENVGNSLVVDYHCSAHNALIGSVMCTQSQEKMYTGFLFKEKSGELWDHIVDKQRLFQFEVETNFRLHRKAVEELRVDTGKATNVLTVGKRGDIEMKYLSSQYLADSSLSTDIPYLGSFFVAGSRYSHAGGTNNIKPAQEEEEESAKKKADESSDTIEDKDILELDEINTNPCMTSILRVMDFMQKTFKSPGTSMPSWMDEMHKKFTDSQTHINIKIFITKIIVNRPAYFEPYCQDWLKPLVQLAVAKDLGGSGLHYFLRDICMVMLKWKDFIPSNTIEGRELASNLVTHLMKNCAHNKRIVLKSNLELIKLLVEKWKDRLRISKDVILGWICFDPKRESAKLARTTGLQLLGVMLANDFLPYDPAFDSKIIAEEKYYEKVIDNIKYPLKEIYEAAAEVCGMVLSTLASRQSSSMNDDEEQPSQKSYEKFEQLLLAECSMFLSKGEHDRFLNCLNKIGIHYPLFLDHFLPTKIVDILPNLFGVYKKTALQIISWRAEHINNLYQSLKPHLQPFLQHKEETTQLMTLEIIYKLLRGMEKKDVVHFLNIVSTELHKTKQVFHAVFSELCRNMYYDILIWLYDNRADTKDIQTIRIELLKGMSDDSQEIRKKLLDFWDHESRLSIESLKRLEEMFTILYSKDLGDDWLKYSTYLLLQLCNRSPDFNDSKAIFSESLANCEFKEYSIDVSWQNRSAPMSAPLFAPTQGAIQSSILASFGGDNAFSFDAAQNAPMQVDPAAPGGIRATPTPQFSITQMSASLRQALSDPSLTQTSLLFVPFKKVAPSQQGDAISSTVDMNAFDKTKLVRRRFLKLKDESLQKHHVKRSIRLKKEKEAWEARQKVERKNRIVMYRKYRTGELPDIQIATKEVILPLQALCLMDIKVAKSMFIAMFEALYPEIALKLNARVSTAMKEQIQKQIKSMMVNSKDCAALISALLSVIYRHSEEFIPYASPELIKEAGIHSFNIELGILAIEKALASSITVKKQKDIMDVEDDDEDSADILTPEEQKEAWIELTKLYKSIDEEDIVRSIFDVHVSSNKELTKSALNQEQAGDYREAFRIYENALNTYYSDPESMTPKPFKQEVQLWEQEKLECLKHLNKWKELNDAVLMEVMDEQENNINRLWDLKNRDALLPHFMNSSLRVREKWDLMQEFISSAFEIQARRTVLESKFSNELATLSLFKNQLEKARSYVIESYSNFVAQWSSLSPLSKKGRHMALQQLQTLVELEEFVNLMQRKPEAKKEAFIGLLKAWHRRFPDKSIDNINVWDIVVSNRAAMLDRLNEDLALILTKEEASDSKPVPEKRIEINSLFDLGASLSQSASSLSVAIDKEEVATKTIISTAVATKILKEQKQFMYLEAAKAARKQTNWNVAHDYLKSSKEAAKEAHSTETEFFDYDFFKFLVKVLRDRALREPNPQKAIEQLSKAEKYILQERTKINTVVKNPYHRIDFRIIYADTKREGAQVMLENNLENSRLGTPQDLLKEAFSAYNTAVERSQQLAAKDPNVNNRKLAKSFMKFGTFCNDLMKQADEKKAEPIIEGEVLATHVVTNYLASMKAGDKMAQQRFPKLLEIIEKYPAVRPKFKQLAAQIPNYMFLPWISQILAHLHGGEGETLVDMLLSLAVEYPQAVYYPFNISKEDIKPSTKIVQKTMIEIEKKLHNPAIEKLINSLDKLTHPELKWKDWYGEIKVALKAKNKEETKSLWKQTFDDLFDQNAAHLGSYNHQFAKNWAPIMKKDFGTREEPAKLLKMDAKTFEQTAAKQFAKMRETPGAMQAGHKKLAHFSTWLADYNQSSEDAETIEIPGQYGAFKKPNPEEHVQIVSFDPNILVMGSIRKPKRVKIHGNDEKDYMFLVKGGEDLRQDQRIEQLFAVMNDVLIGDANCRTRELYLKTYKVIPMTKKVGILEWVDNTMPLKAVIESQLSKLEGTKSEILKHASLNPLMKLIMSLQEPGKPVAQPVLYLRMHQKITREKTLEIIQQQWKLLPADLLKKGLHTLAASAEAFFKIRNRFGRSLSALNICSYILGIGDRHLENFLLDFSDGNIIGIDFGHAYGSATEILPVPELIPFRMTRQLVETVAPLSFTFDQHLALQHKVEEAGGDLSTVPLPGKGGIFFDSMVHTMTALHQNKDILISTMDVFVKEPLVDWLKHANNDQQDDDDEEDKPIEKLWYPQKKVAIAQRKLEMYNPVGLMAMDLNSNRNLGAFAKYAEKTLRGDPKYNARARAPEKCESIQQQVECLIDLATDINVLGKTYAGWSAWV